MVPGRTVRAIGAGAAVLLACAPLPPGAGGARGGGRGEERVHIGSFTTVDAVATSRRFVYAASRGGLAVYDRFSERWLLPVTRDLDRELGREAGFGFTGPPTSGGSLITVLAGDPHDEVLWIGVPGAVLTYRPFTGQVQRTIVTGVPQRIVFERSPAGAGDAFVASGGQWTRVSRVGIATPMRDAPTAAQLLVPPTLGDLLTRFPAVRAQPQLLMAGTSAPNRPLRPLTLLAGAASPDRASELWLGTDGDGLVRLDPVFGQGQPLPFGLLDPGAGALAPAVNGLWVAGLGLDPRRGGLTFVTDDLQQWRWLDGTIAVSLAGARSYAMATRASVGWLATDRGLVRVPLDGDQELQRITRLGGLPDDRVFAVAPREGGAWAATARGLAFVRDSGAASAPSLARLDGVAVYALLATGSTLWAGTASGLVRLPADPDGPGAAESVDASGGGLRRPVRALAASDSVLLVATDDGVFRLSLAGAPAPRPDRVALLEPRLVGDVTRLAADEGTVVLAGRDGVALLSRSTGALRLLRVPADLPGPALDALLRRDWLFVATPQGLVRFRRTADGLVP